MDLIVKLREIVESITEIAEKNGKISIFSIASTANVNNQEILFPAIRETETTICGNILISSKKYLEDIIHEIDGFVDIVLVDSETKMPDVTNLEIYVRKRVKKSKLHTFKPNDLTVEALDTLIAQLKSPIKGQKIAVIGAGNIGSKIALKLVERGANVYITRRDLTKLKRIADGLNAIKSDYINAKVYYTTDNLAACNDSDVVIGTTPGVPSITAEMVNNMKSDGVIIDAGNGTLFPDAIEQAKHGDIKLICLSMKPGYDGALETIFKTEEVILNQNDKTMGNFSIISGGILGKRGDIIVDNVNNPNKIFAIADGSGDVISNIDAEEFQDNIMTVKHLIEEKTR